ncbi:retrovirus-related pol polyprotein from transposon TNT 1-94 [Tanacetum coccineum]
MGSTHMTGNLKLLSNFVEKILGTVKFRNDQIALILGYGDLVQGNVTIKRVYYVEGLNHNLFSVGQFCSHGTNLYSITLQDTYLCEEVYVNKPDGFVDPHHPDKVYRLKKELYGLKQAPRAWYDELSNFLISKGFSKAKYAQEILKKHGMTSCDSIGTLMATKPLDVDLSGTPVKQTKYHSMVGAPMYLKTSRPDIVHATCYCARYQVRPTEKHLKEVKRIFRHLKNTINMGLLASAAICQKWGCYSFELTALSDSDHAGCLDTRKSTSGGIQFLGGDKLVSWSSKKQKCTSISSPEAEYVSLSACCAQVLWMRTQLTDYGFHFDKISMYCDSKEAIAILCNLVQHSRTKHIDLVDLFTKVLPEDRFKYLVRRLDMRCLTPNELEVLAIESA